MECNAHLSCRWRRKPEAARLLETTWNMHFAICWRTPGTTLAYYLPDLQADGAYHRLRITLRRSGLQMVAKAGYFAPIPFAGMSRGAKRDWLYRALLADQPLGEIELSSRSSAFFNPPSPDITIYVAVHAYWWVPQEHASDRRWTMLVGVVQDENGDGYRSPRHHQLLAR